jgi:hypothetical protein
MQHLLTARIVPIIILAAALLPGCQSLLADSSTAGAEPQATATPRSVVRLPLIMRTDPCSPITGAKYTAITVTPPVTDRPAEAHADLNLALRGYTATSGDLGLVTYGSGDPNAPQLPWLFADRRTPVFRGVFRVYDWNWASNSRGAPIVSPPVTLVTLETAPGEIISVPDSGYSIGSGYEVLVLYASDERLTLKYTREDNVVRGYTVHVDGLCVEPSLLALYESRNASGRRSLPALRGGQAVGRARETTIGVAIRDSGSFMDPRSRQDWWQGH